MAVEAQSGLQPQRVAGAEPDGPDKRIGEQRLGQGLEAPRPYDVRWFPNRWPALPGGVCEVVLYTADHDATFWSLGQDGIDAVVRLWAQRSAALAALPNVAYVQVFENRGAEVGGRDRYGRTALSWAAGCGHLEVVKLLLEAKAEVDSKDNYSQTPLSWAAEKGHEAVVRLPR